MLSATYKISFKNWATLLVIHTTAPCDLIFLKCAFVGYFRIEKFDSPLSLQLFTFVYRALKLCYHFSVAAQRWFFLPMDKFNIFVVPFILFVISFCLNYLCWILKCQNSSPFSQIVFKRTLIEQTFFTVLSNCPIFKIKLVFASAASFARLKATLVLISIRIYHYFIAPVQRPIHKRPIIRGPIFEPHSSVALQTIVYEFADVEQTGRLCTGEPV